MMMMMMMFRDRPTDQQAPAPARPRYRFCSPCWLTWAGLEWSGGTVTILWRYFSEHHLVSFTSPLASEAGNLSKHHPAEDGQWWLATFESAHWDTPFDDPKLHSTAHAMMQGPPPFQEMNIKRKNDSLNFLGEIFQNCLWNLVAIEWPL